MQRGTILGILSLTLLLGSLALGQDARPDRQIAMPPAEIQTLYGRITGPPK